MDQVSGTNSTNPIANIDWSSGEGLSAEGILAYCSSRLSILDGMIESRFAEQKKRGQALKDAGELLSIAGRWDGVVAGKDMNAECQGWHQAQAKDLMNLYERTQDPAVRGKIAEAFAMATGRQLSLGADGKAVSSGGLDSNGRIALDLSNIKGISSAVYGGFLTGVKTLQDGISKDSELSMIQMQSIVSQRQLAVQMTTQLMQAKNESVMCVVRNIKGG
jgi:hypothetical protein